MNTDIKILVVDDEPDNRDLFRELLELCGFTSICVEKDGDGALQRLRIEGDIALILTDWSMPLVDGVELTRRVRASPEFAHMKIIMASGETDPREAIAAGVDAFIGKPVDFDELIALIEQFFP